MELILASSSPRRAALLEAAGIAFGTDPPHIDESPLEAERPDDYVVRLARAKAGACERRNPGKIVLAADTTVIIEGQVLGKPSDAEDARKMLQLLAGRTHDVLTGVAVRRDGAEHAAYARTRVRLLPLTEEDMTWYVSTGEPFGKAGGYAIQGFASRFVDWIEGSYSNVVGLPVALTHVLLKQAGWTGR